MKTIIIGEKFNVKYSFRETCFGIVVKNNQILLVKKDNQYSLIGGGIEQNETKEQCLKREFLEESGLAISNIQPLVCVDCFWLAANKYPMESKANIFLVDIDSTSELKPLEEGLIPEWIEIDKALNLLPLPYHKEALKFYFNNTRDQA